MTIDHNRILEPSFDQESDGGLTQWQLLETMSEEDIQALLDIATSSDPNCPGKLRRDREYRRIPLMEERGA
jgi:hypothetical protein